jgi:hypothetical protein
MIHEEICTYEVAKLAKEKGFREKCITHYYDDTKDWYRSSNPQCYNFGGNTSDAPTQSLLQRWLREKKNIHIEIIATASGYYWCVNKTNGTSITDSDILNRGTNEGGCFDTYELALEDTLKYALENLI